MPTTAIAWLRRELRIHDNPALLAAAAGHDQVVPVFVLDRRLLAGRFPSPARAAFLLGCLRDLDEALRARGAGLVLREGRPDEVLPRLAAEVGADAVHFASDVSPFARTRDQRVADALARAGVAAVAGPGNFAVEPGEPRSRGGAPFRVFTPFWRAWERLPRRPVEGPPARLALPDGLDRGTLPQAASLGAADPPRRLLHPGESAAREAMGSWLSDGIDGYASERDRLAAATSELSPYLHFGCLSARELEHHVAVLHGEGPAAFRRQLCWRDFYAHVLLHHPQAARLELQERMRGLRWDDDPELLAAWREGRTGYPIVDAAMRQLGTTGYMHNRARLIAGSFLTKDLHLDWRAGERHFMASLIDGDEASNNGNWQWIASVGADPAPYFRRLLNPVLQQQRHDPDGEYVRRWVPELRGVPLERLAEPWRMSEQEQLEAGCVIGRDYPAPVVDHARERRRAIERYRAVTES